MKRLIHKYPRTSGLLLMMAMLAAIYGVPALIHFVER